jgi:hypothetical protein
MLMLCKGAVSSLDSEHACPSSQHTTLATDASSGEGQFLSSKLQLILFLFVMRICLDSYSC